MRNRNIDVLVCSRLHLRRLLVGNADRVAGIRPCITNQVRPQANLSSIQASRRWRVQSSSTVQTLGVLFGRLMQSTCTAHAFVVQALVSIGQLTTLTELQLASCNALTANGTPELAPLSRLRVLSFDACTRIGDRALAALLPALGRLELLSVTGCRMVSLLQRRRRCKERPPVHVCLSRVLLCRRESHVVR